MTKVNLYSKEEIDRMLENIETDTYSKEEIDNKIDNVTANVYTKSEVNTLIENLSENVYTKNEVNTLVENATTKTKIVLVSMSELFNYLTTKTLKPGDYVTAEITYTDNNVSMRRVLYFTVVEHSMIGGTSPSVIGYGMSFNAQAVEGTTGFDFNPARGIQINDNNQNELIIYETIVFGTHMSYLSIDVMPSNIRVEIVTNEED